MIFIYIILGLLAFLCLSPLLVFVLIYFLYDRTCDFITSVTGQFFGVFRRKPAAYDDEETEQAHHVPMWRGGYLIGEQTGK